MNNQSLEQLDYLKMKQQLLEYAVSYLGKQHVEQMQPLTNVKWIRTKLDETEEALNILKAGGHVPIPSLTGIDSLLQLLGKGYVFTEEDFANLITFINSCRQLKRYMESKQSIADNISRYATSMYSLNELQSEIERCVHNGRIVDTASKNLNKIRKKIYVIEERLKSKLDQLLSKNQMLLQENLVHLRDGRYVLPIKKEHRKRINGQVLGESASGQTVFIEPIEVSRFQHELVILRMEEAKEEAAILGQLTDLVEHAETELRMNVETVGMYDFLFAKAKYAMAVDAGNVELNERGEVNIQEARHPLMGAGMVPLNFSIGVNYKHLIITGPNTGGKTVALKTIGLLVLMVQSGLLVPVKRSSTFSVFSKVFVDIGDGQSIEQSLSTFSAHIKNVIEILSQADESTFIVLDEMATGTDPGEGVSLAIAILEELQRKGATVVATTHFNEIKHFASVAEGFENARMEFDAQSLQPLYRLRIGEAGESYALLIARKLGIAPELIRRSQQMMAHRGAIGDYVSKSAQQANHQTNVQRTNKRQRNSNNNDKKRVSTASAMKRFEVGDRVYAAYMNQLGTVFKEVDGRGNVGVMIKNQKLYINQKRLTLHIEKEELYPEDYDLDIVFESKENRKRRKLMSRKHVEGLTIVKKQE